MTQLPQRSLDPEKVLACNTLLGTIHELLRSDSMLKKLVGVSTSEELLFFGAVIAYGRFLESNATENPGFKQKSFEWFIESCSRIRGQALVLISEKTLGVGKRRPRRHFFRCTKEGGTYS